MILLIVCIWFPRKKLCSFMLLIWHEKWVWATMNLEIIYHIWQAYLCCAMQLRDRVVGNHYTQIEKVSCVLPTLHYLLLTTCWEVAWFLKNQNKQFHNIRLGVSIFSSFHFSTSNWNNKELYFGALKFDLERQLNLKHPENLCS